MQELSLEGHRLSRKTGKQVCCGLALMDVPMDVRLAFDVQNHSEMGVAKLHARQFVLIRP
jgi:hypothetical protein